MSNKPPLPMDEDERSAIEKVMAGDIRKFNTLNGIEAARMVSGLVPGVGQLADLPLAVAQGNLEADKKYNAIRNNWGNLRSAASQSRGIREEMKKLESRWQGRLGEAIVALIGGLAGMWVGSMLIGSALFFIPFAGVIGGIVGGVGGAMLADVAYNAAFPSQSHYGTALSMAMHKAQARGEGASPQMVFAVLASNLPKRARKRIEKDLERMTGSNSFNAAIADGRINELTVLMRRYDLEIRADTHMKRDAGDIGKTASEQYAEWVNSGMLDPRKLMITKGLPTEPLQMQAAPQESAPVTPPATPVTGRGLGKNTLHAS